MSSTNFLKDFHGIDPRYLSSPTSHQDYYLHSTITHTTIIRPPVHLRDWCSPWLFPMPKIASLKMQQWHSLSLSFESYVKMYLFWDVSGTNINVYMNWLNHIFFTVTVTLLLPSLVVCLCWILTSWTSDLSKVMSHVKQHAHQWCFTNK